MKRFIIVSLFIFSCLVVNCHAMELTLEQCISKAIENNTGLKAHEIDVLVSEQDIQIARSKFFPSLKLQGKYTLRNDADVFVIPRNSFTNDIPPTDVDISANNRETYGVDFSLTQPVFTGKKLTHAFLKAKILNEGARHNFERQKKLLVFDVTIAYYRVIKEKLYIKILEEVIKSKKETIRVLRERFNEGYIRKEDIVTAEVDLSVIELELLKSQNSAEYALSVLARLIDYQNNETLELKGEPINQSLRVSLQEVKDSALTHREDIKGFHTITRAADEEVSIAKSGFYPEISIEGRYSLQKDTNVTRPDAWIFIAQMDWPLFEWNRTRAEVKKAVATKQKLMYEHEELTKSIMLAVEESWRTAKETAQEVEVKEKKLKATEYIYKLSAERYAEGAINLAEFQDAETEFIRAYNEYLIALTQVNIAIARLKTSISYLHDDWVDRREIYKPDIQSLLHKRKSVIPSAEKQGLGKQPDSKIPEDTTTGMELPDIGKNTDILSPEAKVSHVTQESCYAIQAGAFRSEQSAESFKNQLSRRIHNRTIRIQHQGDFYKVRVIGFKEKNEAVLVRDEGIQGIVIKTDISECNSTLH